MLAIYLQTQPFIKILPMPQKPTDTAVVIQTVLLASKLSKKADLQLSLHGISFTEYLVMHYLDSAPHQAVPRIELADYIGMSASGITRLVAPLEKSGILEKVASKRDARQSLVRLSKSGRRLYQEAGTSFEHIANGLVGHLNQNQLAKLLELYAKIF